MVCIVHTHSERRNRPAKTGRCNTFTARNTVHTVGKLACATAGSQRGDNSNKQVRAQNFALARPAHERRNVDHVIDKIHKARITPAGRTTVGRDFCSFPLARYRFEWRATSPLRMPEYAGSMLRGAFGHALRQLSCMTRQKQCEGCPLIASCPFPAIFAPLPPDAHTLQKFSDIPVPYIIEPPDWGVSHLAEGDTFSFHLVLVGRAIKELPLIILAWRRALARGVGPDDGKAELVRVVHCGEAQEMEIHNPESGTINEHEQAITINTTAAQVPDRVCLEFTTPLRLQRNGHALAPHRLDARTLLMALVRRTNLLSEFHAGGPLIGNFSALLQSCAAIVDEKNLTWRDWTRYSSRQKQAMTLGGVVGQWQLRGDLAPFYPYLLLGQWLHVGKEAAFGLGRYRLADTAA